MPSFAPKSASETLKPTPAPAAPKAAEQTSDIEQEIKELDSIAKMMESTFDKPQNKEPSKPQSAQELKFVRILYKTLLDNEVDEKYINQILDEIERFLRPGNSLDVILSNVYQKLILRFGQPETIKVNGKNQELFSLSDRQALARQPQLLKLLQNSRLIIIKISHLSLLIHTE